MSEVLILGGGKQGGFIARKLGGWGIATTIWDISPEVVERVSLWSNVKVEKKNFFRVENLARELEKYDVIVESLPGELGFRALQHLVSLGKKVVSISFMKEDYFLLEEEARRNGATVIPDCALAPGLTNLLLANGISRLGTARRGLILIGGLPTRPVPPFYHNITWSIYDLIEEYKRPARVRRNGIIREINPLSEIRPEIGFPVSDIVSFPTDGLRSLLRTTNLPDLEERTLRYSSHVEKMKVLDELGFFDEDHILLLNASYPRRHITARMIESKFTSLSPEDIVLGRVEIRGEFMAYIYEISGEYDYERGESAMSRSSGTPAAVFVKFLLDKDITQTGILPLEFFGEREDILYRTVQELKKEGILVKEKRKSLK